MVLALTCPTLIPSLLYVISFEEQGQGTRATTLFSDHNIICIYYVRLDGPGDYYVSEISQSE